MDSRTGKGTPEIQLVEIGTLCVWFVLAIFVAGAHWARAEAGTQPEGTWPLSVVFAALLALAAAALATGRLHRRGDLVPQHWWLLTLQCGLVLLLCHAANHYITLFLILVVAPQLAWVAPMWVGAFIVASVCTFGIQIEIANGMAGEQIYRWLMVVAIAMFVFVLARFAEGERRGRMALDRSHAELVATQRLLEETARQSERLRISRELHDVLGHTLTAMSLKLEWLRNVSQPGEVRDEIEALKDLTRTTLENVRDVVSELRHDAQLDIGAAVEELVADLRHLSVEVQVEPGLEVNDPVLAHSLLRCAQEAVTNVARHARAQHLLIRLSRDGDDVVLLVEDDGIGPRSRMAAGNGLRGTEERLRALGGRLTVGPRAERGFRLEAAVPAT